MHPSWLFIPVSLSHDPASCDLVKNLVLDFWHQCGKEKMRAYMLKLVRDAGEPNKK